MNELKKMTKQERLNLQRQLREMECQEKQERDSYRDLVDETVMTLFPALQETSKMLSDAKKMVFESFENLLEMKSELFGIRANQQSHTFTSKDGKISIVIGHRVVDNYDDTIEEGVAKVKEYLSSLAKDEASGSLVNTVMKLLSKDKKGNLKASRVIELEQIALESNHEAFLEGIKIIKEAYRPQKSCDFITVSIRDEQGMERNLPLAISSAEMGINND